MATVNKPVAPPPTSMAGGNEKKRKKSTHVLIISYLITRCPVVYCRFPISFFFFFSYTFVFCVLIFFTTFRLMCSRFKLPKKYFMTDMSKEYYDIKLVQLGCEVRGIDLKTENRPEVIERIKEDVTKYRLLVFKDQGIIDGDRHVEISKWFGELESTFYKHPKSPHPDVFRVSNDEEEGCTGVGRTGWHIDGSFQSAPFSYSLYHMVSVPKRGATSFAPLAELIERLPKAKREEWDRIWMVSDRRTGPVHPLIYRHPITTKEVLCFHLGMTSVFLYDFATDNERLTSKEETRRIMNDIHEEFVRDGGSIQYVHNWEAGDFIISDNLAVGHEATPETQAPRSKVGLRILHRTTIKGTVPPAK